ncbi:hypothetical protein [Amycolatopsis sp. SID8362]|uniref:hypothetical protein n=1 Tax=Amycolatopsis sp. SID8362 TaxID=2690346 RepID=UPI0013680944|nr:hypothetical protein [Amycolatopsis sp. SID8362]NBH06048.1 hypothetical protein [Amycolatopsis sp. SID8362]NED42747.1 hypothetical protein [Amycolatopsis sp. SID8362]
MGNSCSFKSEMLPQVDLCRAELATNPYSEKVIDNANKILTLARREAASYGPCDIKDNLTNAANSLETSIKLLKERNRNLATQNQSRSDPDQNASAAANLSGQIFPGIAHEAFRNAALNLYNTATSLNAFTDPEELTDLTEAIKAVAKLGGEKAKRHPSDTERTDISRSLTRGDVVKEAARLKYNVADVRLHDDMAEAAIQYPLDTNMTNLGVHADQRIT